MRMEKQTEEIEQYSKNIGLDHRLIHASRTKEQADALLSMETAILKYDRHGYQALAEQNQKINDPYRDKASIISKIEDIEQYMDKYYGGLMFISEKSQLKKLRQRIDQSVRYTTKEFQTHILNTVVKDLLKMGFNENIITKGTKDVPALKSTFNSLLTE